MSYTSNAGYLGKDQLTVTVNDLGNTGSGGAQTTTTIIQLNDLNIISPVISVPVSSQAAPIDVTENTPFVFSSASSYPITITDKAQQIQPGGQVTLTVTNGTLTVPGTAATVSGNGTSSVTITGFFTAISSELDGLTYTPNSGYSGTDTLIIQASDEGNTTLSIPRSSTATVSLLVETSNQAPMITAPTSAITVLTAPLAFSSAPTPTRSRLLTSMPMAVPNKSRLRWLR